MDIRPLNTSTVATRDAADVVPSDTNPRQFEPSLLHVTGAGTLTFWTEYGNLVHYGQVAVGEVPISLAVGVKASETTATLTRHFG